MLNAAELCPTAQRIAREFCGNEEAVRALGAMIEGKRLPHAFIIEGADGLGKSTFARIIARGAMCACREPLSGECEHCRKNRGNIHPDLMVVLGSGKINAISIESVRAMRKDAMIAPNEAEKRVFILEDCDNMLPAAQNAFLKIFEEAPPHVIFIMTWRLLQMCFTWAICSRLPAHLRRAEVISVKRCVCLAARALLRQRKKQPQLRTALSKRCVRAASLIWR